MSVSNRWTTCTLNLFFIANYSTFVRSSVDSFVCSCASSPFLSLDATFGNGSHWVGTCNSQYCSNEHMLCSFYLFFLLASFVHFFWRSHTHAIDLIWPSELGFCFPLHLSFCWLLIWASDEKCTARREGTISCSDAKRTKEAHQCEVVHRHTIKYVNHSDQQACSGIVDSL